MHADGAEAATGQECAPGVGDYELAYTTEPSAPAFTFPRTARAVGDGESGMGHDAANLGPGAYVLPSVDHGPAYTMGEAPKERIVPGATVAFFETSVGSVAATILHIESHSHCLNA